jgi:acyl carrier protein
MCKDSSEDAAGRGATMKELETKLREIIGALAETSNPVELKLGTDLFDELGLDSMHALEIILEVEEVFGISVQDSALEHIRTLEDILKAASEAMVEG